MISFQGVHREMEQRNILRLLAEIDERPNLTQRALAAELGIALGLLNQYLKHCLSRGWIRITRISPNRLSYFLTPEGISEKGAMVSSYLTKSFHFFRDAKLECDRLLCVCRSKEWNRIALFGAGDLADIATLVMRDSGIKGKIIIDAEKCVDFDAVLLTNLSQPQKAFNALNQLIPAERILTPSILHISRRENTRIKNENL